MSRLKDALYFNENVCYIIVLFWHVMYQIHSEVQFISE
jgi:hypothetical protein